MHRKDSSVLRPQSPGTPNALEGNAVKDTLNKPHRWVIVEERRWVRRPTLRNGGDSPHPLPGLHSRRSGWSDPDTVPSAAAGVALPVLGDRLLDEYLAFVAARCWPNTALAVAFDLRVFFRVV